MTKRQPFFPEHYYHLYTHAVGRDNLFRTPENYRYFLTRYAIYAPPVVETFAYCLMPNHVHFLVRVRSCCALHQFFGASRLATMDLNRAVANQLGHGLNAYAKAYNRRYRRRGRLFVAKMHRKPVTDDRYLLTLVRYIHLNPVRHGFVAHPDDWAYSSFRAIRTPPHGFLAHEQVLEWFGGADRFLALHRPTDGIR